MKQSSRLSDVLHVLLHLADADVPLTSETLASAMSTNPVVLRRLLAGLREAGLVASAKGHGGGWMMAAPLERVTLHDVHLALGSPSLISLGFRQDQPKCLVAQVVNDSLRTAMQEAETALRARLDSITLAELSKAFDQRLQLGRLAGGSNVHRMEHHHAQD